MASSQYPPPSDPVTIDALPRVVEPISACNEGKESAAEKGSAFHRVLSTPPQRKEKGRKRGRDDLNGNTEVSKQPVKKKRCRVKVADDKFSLKTKKAKVKIPKPVKVKRDSFKKDSQNKRKYVRKKKEHPNAAAVRPPEAADDALGREVAKEMMLDSSKGEELKGACQRALTPLSASTAQVFEVATEPPSNETATDNVGREVFVSKEMLLESTKGEEIKGTCRRALEFNDENLTHVSASTAQLFEVAPEPPSPEDGKLIDKAVEPPLLLEEKINNCEVEEGYMLSDRLLNLAEQKDSPGPSNETLDFEEVNTICATVSKPELDTNTELKAFESLWKDTSTLIVYARKRKNRRTVSDGAMLVSAGQENTRLCRQESNLKVKNATTISQTNTNKTYAASSSNSKNGYRLEVLHVPLVSNGRNMRACQCVQVMRKCKPNILKINKQRRMVRKKRVDVSGLALPFGTRKQMRSKKSISRYLVVSIPPRKQRSQGVTRKKDFSSLLTVAVGQFNKLAACAEQQCNVQVPETDIWPTHDSLVTISRDTLREEEVCVESQEVDPNEEPQLHGFDSLFTINEHLFANDTTDGSGNASQKYESMQSDSALQTGLDYSTMSALSCQHSYSNTHSLVPWTNEQVSVHNNVHSEDNFYPHQNSSSLQTDYSFCLGADFHSAGQPPLLDSTYNNKLLNPGQFSVIIDQECIPEANGGLWSVSEPNHENLLYNNQLLVPHLELGSTAEATNYSVNSHILVPYDEPSTVNGQEFVARVDNSLDVINNVDNRALVTSIKKKKVIPHVNYDSKTLPMWNALMGTEDSRDKQCNEDEESKKWWQEERRVFKEKVKAFISCMHKIQGNRRFSQWKGSILDSVMGVFLTQNVSDHLSSSAYMSLAAKYPVAPNRTQNADQEEYEVVGASQESCGSNEGVLVYANELSDQEFLNDRLLDGEQTAGLQDSIRTENNPVKVDSPMPTVGLSGFEEWLSLQEQVTQPRDSLHSKSEIKDCLSQQEQTTVSQNPSLSTSETEELLSQEEHLTQPCNSSHPKFETEESISHQQVQMTQPQNSPHPVSELPMHKSDPLMHPQDSFLPKSVTDGFLSRQEEKKGQHRESTHPKVQKNKTPEIDWLKTKRKYCNGKREINKSHTDSVDWDAVRRAPVGEVAEAIKKRGQHNILAASIQRTLNRIFSELGSLDLEWLRDTPPDVTKNFLLSIDGLGLKSVECIRLLALEQVAFPVDTNVGRIAVRLGWVDLKDVPEGLQFHLLEQYPLMDAIQKYLWPRLCELDQLTLYELHYQMITFGKVFCKKRSPFCNACPLRASCKYFASAYVSAHLPITDSADAGSSQSLPLIEQSGTQSQTTNHEPTVEMPSSPGPCIATHTDMPTSPHPYTDMPTSPQPYAEMLTSPQPSMEIPTSPQPFTGMPTSPKPDIGMPAPPQPYSEMPTFPEEHHLEVLEPRDSSPKEPACIDPIIEMPRTPESEPGDTIGDIEDLYTDGPEIPTIVLNDEEFITNVRKYIDEKKFQTGAEFSNALVVSAQGARLPPRKLKNIKDLRTEHLVYEIPDSHPLLRLHGLEERSPNDQCFYLLSIWGPDESVAFSSQTGNANTNCIAEERNSEEKCSDNCRCQQHDVDYVLGTFMIPCRTAMQGRFPLNGTYFQVNEVFADDESSHCPVKIPRSFLWNLNKCIVYCGSSVSSITTGLTTEEIQVCFWRDYLCVRGFNRRTREPKELVERLHKLKSATQTKRPSATDQRKPKKNKNGEQIGDISTK